MKSNWIPNLSLAIGLPTKPIDFDFITGVTKDSDSIGPLKILPPVQTDSSTERHVSSGTYNPHFGIFNQPVDEFILASDPSDKSNSRVNPNKKNTPLPSIHVIENIVTDYLNLYDYNGARQYLSNAISETQNLHGVNTIAEAQLYALLGKTAGLEGHEVMAHKAFKRAYNIFRELKQFDSPIIIPIMLDYAEFLISIDDLSLAVNQLISATDILLQWEESETEERLGSLLEIILEKSALSKNITMVRQVLPVVVDVTKLIYGEDSYEVIDVNLACGLAFLEMGTSDSTKQAGRQYIQDCILRTQHRSEEETWACIRTLDAMYSRLTELGEIDLAITSQQAKDIISLKYPFAYSQATGEQTDVIELMKTGAALLQTGYIIKSRRTFQKAYDQCLVRFGEQHTFSALALTWIGNTLLLEGLNDFAIEKYRKAIAIYNAIKAPKNSVEYYTALVSLYKAYSENEQYEEALKIQAEIADIIRSNPHLLNTKHNDDFN